ncbi:MAG: chorismate synthase [Clostridiales bacterium]|nr:chorismate synthase [Clostridiales bacterium]
MSMDSTYKGKVLELKIYGQSHSPTIGVFIKGLSDGVRPDEDFTRSLMARRAPGNNKWSTPRKEKDEVIFEQGEENTIHGYIVNTNTKPKDYASIMNKPRPGHADYTGKIKFKDEAAQSGGGIFSGRMTAPLCIAGSIALNELNKRGIEIYAHLKRCGGIDDDSCLMHEVNDEDFRRRLSEVKTKEFPVVSDEAGEQMKAKIEEARLSLDSVGAVVECVIYGLPAGLGGPIFDGLEGKIASLIYAIPAVKGVEFGAGFDVADMRGSRNNDEFRYEGDKVTLATNNCGGILGGISVGEAAPLVFDCAFKPTPSIAREQNTIDIMNKENTTISIEGRHDPCVAPRAVPVVEAAAAIAIYDEILAEEINEDA